MRIGVVEHFYTEDAEANPAYVKGIQHAAEMLRELGAILEPVRLSRLQDWNECGRVIQQYEQYRVHEKWLKTRPQDYSTVARTKFDAGAAVSPFDLKAATERRALLRAQFAGVMQGYDALITLSSLELPCRVDDPEAVQRTYMRHARMPFNVTGTPAIAVPTGFTDEGLPLGMQIAGRANDEAMVYRVAYAYEQATRWAERFRGALPGAASPSASR